MLELVSVNVENFRSFSTGEFVPLGIGQGMTAINGSNGMGKSSIVHALVWALYGVTPDGVPVRALRRQGSEGEVVASVVIRHDGQTIEITRALRGRNDTTIASIKVDGVEQTNVSSKTATQWVQNRLNLDAEAFLTAFVVRQKELDSLVKARPADRRKTIERLAGIERMSAALDLARQDARTASRLLDAMPAAEDPETAQARVEAAIAVLEAAQAEYDVAAQEAEAAKNAQTQAEAAVRLARQAGETYTNAKSAVALAEQRVDSAEEALESLRVRAAGAENIDAARTAAQNARAARNEAEQTLSAVDAIVARAEAASRRCDDANTELQSAERTLVTARERLAALDIADVPADIEQQVADANARVEELAAARGAARGEWERLKKAIDTLTATSHAHDASCPTCAQPLADPQALLDAQEVLLADVQKRGTQIAAEYEEATLEVTRLTKIADDARLARINQANAQQAVADAERIVSEKTALVARLADEAETAAEAAHEAEQGAAKAKAALPSLQDAENAAQAALRQAENATEAADELVAVQVRYDALINDLETAQEAYNAAKNALAGLDLEGLEAVAQDASVSATTAAERASGARTARMLADRDVTEANDALARAQSAAEQRKSALAEVERTTAVASAMEEFRRDRLARLAPELSEVASDFVARMTDGRYTAVELDEEFTPILTDASGDQRPVAWLSGGEESAVALSLRIAIGEVLAGQRGGLLILDEVLTAQDPLRRQATMGAIRALPRQTITINHVSEATDMVDLVAEIVSDGDGASTVHTYTPDHAVSSNLSDALVDA